MFKLKYYTYWIYRYKPQRLGGNEVSLPLAVD